MDRDIRVIVGATHRTPFEGRRIACDSRKARLPQPAQSRLVRLDTHQTPRFAVRVIPFLFWSQSIVCRSETHSKKQDIALANLDILLVDDGLDI